MSKPLKIAIYSGELPSTTFIERLIIGLSQQGVQVYLFGFIKNNLRYNKNVSVFGYKNTKIHKGLHLLKFSVLLFLFKNKEKTKLDRILKNNSNNSLKAKGKFYPVLWHHPDVFHLQWAKGLDDWMWVQEFGMKFVLSLRGAHINYSPISDLKLAEMYCKNFPKVDIFHAVSKAIGLEAHKYGASPERVQVVYSGLPLDALTPAVNKGKEVFYLLSVGRSHWKKGYVYALDACKLLKDQGFQFRYTIVGGHSAIELQYQIYDLGLQDYVQLIKQQPYNTVQKMIQAADLLVLPSIEEGIANVVLEAMALGTLVLSTNCGGMAEVIKHGHTGFLVPVRDAIALADMLKEIDEMPYEVKLAISTNARRLIEQQHREVSMTEGMITLYKNVLNPSTR